MLARLSHTAVLPRRSWSISEARSAEEAIELCLATAFDLVVMDEVFDTPMRGSEAIAQIRRNEASRPNVQPAAIVSCTGHAGIQQAATRPAGGPDCVWSKPFPDFTDGSMQRQLAELLSSRRPRPLAQDGASVKATANAAMHCGSFP